MEKRQFRVLYREFLFRLVDRDLLSSDARTDSNKLFGQFATVLGLVGIFLAGLALTIENHRKSQAAILVDAWSVEHTLIATTMLIIGLFGVLSWDSAFPDRRDVLVLTPLPLRARTIFLAKVASLASALSIAVLASSAAPGIVLPFVLVPHTYLPLEMLLSSEIYRGLAAYWITMFTAAAFILCSLLVIQGIAAQFPRRIFLRLSAFLQMGALCLLIGVYFLEPSFRTAQSLADPRNQQALAWLPSYWFLGIFQQLRGAPMTQAHTTLVALAERAWIGLACALAGSAVVYLLSYFRTLRKIVEEPDILPAPRRLNWLPRFGTSLNAAVEQFTIRTLFRSRQHRLLLSFYCGIGFAILILFLKTPVAQVMAARSATSGWRQVTLPLLASSFVITCLWTLGIRAVFALPLDLRANWIFRLCTSREPSEYFSATRRAMYALVPIPLCLGFAAVFLSVWPWRPAVEHLAVLALTSMTLTELSLYGFQKIPFTCSYLPGKSNFHMRFLLFALLGLNAILWASDFERGALSNPTRYGEIIAVLCFAAVVARWRTQVRARSEETRLLFEEEWAPVIVSLALNGD
ncbi:MAG: hypothetical protein WA324_01305 [Bryobacteraceae bacterium]